MKDSFVLYNSFYEPIKTLKNEQLGKLLRAIFNYTINGEITQDAEIMIAFMFIKNQLDIDNEKYKKICERNKNNGSKGGRPKKPTGLSGLEEKPKKPDNDNDNEYDNDNDINNSSSSYNNNIYEYAEKNFGRLITPVECQKLDNWKISFDEELIRYAIKIAVLGNKKTFNYVNGILNNWKSKGYKTIQEIKDEKIKNEEPEEYFEYDWLNEED